MTRVQPPIYSTVHEYIQDTLDKLRTNDPSFTKLKIDDFHYPNVNLDGLEFLESETIVSVLEQACSNDYVSEIVLRLLILTQVLQTPYFSCFILASGPRFRSLGVLG